MDYTNLFIELLRLSPFVATLFVFLFTVWNTQQKTNAALITTMKEHAASQLAMQEKGILASNNMADSTRQMADSTRQMAHSITDMKTGIVQSQEELVNTVNDLRYSKTNTRPTASRKVVPISTAEA